MESNSGFILIDKRSGFTSQDVDSLVKKQTGASKVGHLGTLDPFATGLLIVATNQATKLLPLVNDDYKEYLATLKLGVKTDTLDIDGKVVEEKEVPPLTDEKIISVLNSFLGVSTQKVPMYSAKKINGQKLYSLARKNVEVETPKIQIEVKSIEFISYLENEITFKITVSKGSYIRAIGLDIAKKMNTVSHLTSLRRTKIGKYDVSDAVLQHNIKQEDIIEIQSFFDDIPSYNLKEEDKNSIFNGHPLKIDFNDEYVFIKDCDRLLALYKKDDKLYRCFRRFQIGDK